MLQGMKSVMVFDPADTDEQAMTKFMDWKRDNSSVGDKAVPNAEKTREYLNRYKREIS